MFTVALFTVAKICKPTKCPLIDKYVYTYICVCIYIHTHISPIKQNEILTFATTWINLDDTMLSETSQIEKDN